MEIESIRKMLARAADTGHSNWHERERGERETTGYKPFEQERERERRARNNRLRALRAREGERGQEHRSVGVGRIVHFLCQTHLVSMQGSGFRVQGSGFRVQGSGFRV